MQDSSDVSQHIPWITHSFSKSSPTLFYIFGSYIKYVMFISALFPICCLFTSELLRSPYHRDFPGKSDHVHTSHKTDTQYFQANCCVRPKIPYSAYEWLNEVSKREEKQGNHVQSSFSSPHFSHWDFFSSDAFSIHLLSIMLLESTLYFFPNICLFLASTGHYGKQFQYFH